MTTTFNNTWLPAYPYAADEYTDGVYRMSRERALEKKSIQPNSTALVNLIAIDIDQPESVMRVLESNDDLLPHYVTENPANGHTHAMWAVQEPVTISADGRPAPRRYLKAIHHGITNTFGGDKGYSGLLTKNPHHPHWDTYHSPTLAPYTLDQLATALDTRGTLPPRGWERVAKRDGELTGISRNVDLFDATREQAYKRVRDYRHHTDGADMYGQYVNYIAHQLNKTLGFATPLPTAEVNSIARSITKWVIRESGMWQGDAPAWIAKQRKASQAAATKRSQARVDTVERARDAYLHSGMTMTNRQIAEYVGMSVKWVEKHRAAIKGDMTNC